MKRDRAQAPPPSEINRLRRRPPQHVQDALDEATPLCEANHALFTAMRAHIPPDSPAYVLLLEATANNARVAKLLTDAQLGR